ncbi:D-lyxose/D-mannose family sugar isomerase [Leptotrichia sp. OH3620_COT-345]|uniref:D-lyxose/D-mannose family sugar isomerase n=1 Tax=Leptotrichia sp. OH3620_COT-345 TaxID=2491048 RepID=UPI000F654E4A|nr:D-lyxose/D-mannose family sugar isomerase [Leptotrichia sp. OH3620_COT-345]RRD40237.1 D-lyxose/D-mannose family sugar isomerase [Leptotrichia sp. OH3620_COT-345]
MDKLKKEVREKFLKSGMTFTEKELNSIEYADFGLNNFKEEGLSLIVYENNSRYCAKEMVLLEYQTCPEHLHPNRGKEAGKKETFRCRKGTVYLFVEGKETDKINSEIKIPEGKEKFYTVKHCIKLSPGEQYTIEPDTKHWFQAGKEGAVISEFSSNSDDASDIFTNPDIIRVN